MRGFGTFVLFSWLGAADAEPPQLALLPSSEARAATQTCSRTPPSVTTGTWEPSAADVDGLRRNLSRLVGLKSTECCMPGTTLETLNGVRIQVVGVIRSNGRKALYLNALSRNQLKDVTFSSKAIKVCDGGEAFWGALYDPEDGTFSELAFNGIG